ncbi:amidohydrolase family protein [Microbacterium gilvum]|uniref:Amidohydrolase n=1 Tax=Microbacterium gilvum TaxID=1336204 RepID=A0ABP9A3F4_9MICO
MTPSPLLRATPTRRPSAILDSSVWNGEEFVAHRDVLIEDGAIVEVRAHDDRGWSGADAIDGRGSHVLPGFANTHTHLQQSTCRGVGEGQPLLSWLLTVGEHMADVAPERAYLAAVAGALEGLRSGSTTLVEHMWPHPSPEVHDAVLRGLRDVGVRAVLGRGVADRADAGRRWGFDPRLMQPLDDALADVDRLRAAAAGSRVTIGLAVPNPRTLTPEGMRVVRAFADARDMPVMIHLLETTTDDEQCRAHTGMDAVAYLHDAGFVWERLLAVHAVQLSREAMDLFAAHGVGVSWNPVSNLRLGSGFAPVLAMREAGVAVSVGVDGAGSNDRQDMLETIRTAAYTQRAAHGRADLLDAADMIGMATHGLGGTPGIAAGTRADLTVIRFDRDFACLPVTDAAASLLTTGTPRIVDTVMVGGEVVVDDGRSTRIDEEALATALARLA